MGFDLPDTLGIVQNIPGSGGQQNTEREFRVIQNDNHGWLIMTFKTDGANVCFHEMASILPISNSLMQGFGKPAACPMAICYIFVMCSGQADETWTDQIKNHPMLLVRNSPQRKSNAKITLKQKALWFVF